MKRNKAMRQKEINRINISKNDFDVCIEYLRELDNVDEGSYAYEALWMISIISYYRPFTSNEIEKDSKADSKIEMPEMSAMEIELHNKLKFCRMKIIAHSAIKTNPTSTNSDAGIIWRKRPDIWSILQEYNILKDDVIALANKMLTYCHNKSADLININSKVKS